MESIWFYLYECPIPSTLGCFWTTSLEFPRSDCHASITFPNFPDSRRPFRSIFWFCYPADPNKSMILSWKTCPLQYFLFRSKLTTVEPNFSCLWTCLHRWSGMCYFDSTKFSTEQFFPEWIWITIPNLEMRFIPSIFTLLPQRAANKNPRKNCDQKNPRHDYSTPRYSFQLFRSSSKQQLIGMQIMHSIYMKKIQK